MKDKYNPMEKTLEKYDLRESDFEKYETPKMELVEENTKEVRASAALNSCSD